MAEQPEASIPQQAGAWSQTLATYRFLHNERVTPTGIQQGAIQQTRQACQGLAVVLCLHDLTQLKPVYGLSDTKLLQHTVLAVAADASLTCSPGKPDASIDPPESPPPEAELPEAELPGAGIPGVGIPGAGVLSQRWFDDPKAPAGERRSQRRSRWTRSQVWPEAIEAMGPAEGSTRWITVADCEADDMQVFDACHRMGQGFVIRSQHDRRVVGGGYLREVIEQQPVAGCMSVAVARRGEIGPPAPPKRQRQAQPSRVARVLVRYATLTLQPPANDPRHDQPLRLQVVQAREIDPAAHVDSPINWLLLTSEPVTCLTDALRIVRWYRQRWVIEELHKAQKTGCRLEATQLQDVAAFKRLAAIATLTAVRLLQLRDWADDPVMADEPAIRHVDELWVRVVSRVAKHRDPATLTMQQMHHTIASQGGWLGRKHDGRPGWQTLWRGWQRIATYVQGIELMQPEPP